MMKMTSRVLILGFGLSLTACAMTPGITPIQAEQTHFVQACGAYNAAFSVALKLRQAGKLSAAQISDISQNDMVVYPICTGPLPPNTTEITADLTKVTASVATLAVISKGAAK